MIQNVEIQTFVSNVDKVHNTRTLYSTITLYYYCVSIVSIVCNDESVRFLCILLLIKCKNKATGSLVTYIRT